MPAPSLLLHALRLHRPPPAPRAIPRRTALALGLASIAWGSVGTAGAQPMLPPRDPPVLALPPVPAPPRPAGPGSGLDAVDRDTGPASRTIRLEADRIAGTPGGQTEAEGDVRLERGAVRMRADRVLVDEAAQRLHASGQVRLQRGGDRFAGSELDLSYDGESGYVLLPRYWFSATQAGGDAARIELTGPQRLRAESATYTSCPIDGSGDPDWLLSTRSVRMDVARNEGVAEGAVLRFMGVPILALPVLSFPLTGERKTGWLPPDINLDTKSGLDVSVPWYWNIAPSLDATLTPRIVTRRGAGFGAELRYLGDQRRGIVTLDGLPHDALTGDPRWAFGGAHDGRLDADTRYEARWLRVSDNAFWKDFSRNLPSPTPRLLPSDGGIERQLPWGASAYARVQQWQPLQDADPANAIVAPYQRLPQLGLRWESPVQAPWLAHVEGEFNRFTLPTGAFDPARPDGDRLHALATLAWPLRAAGGALQLTPRVSVNAAAYDLTRLPIGAPALPRRSDRVIPSASLDAQLVLERDTRLFGREVRQTLEPRAMYLRTPFRDQSQLPNFDAAARDFNFESLFADNAFAGVDRVSDADQVTLGATSRILGQTDGAELLRLGVAQRILLRDQRVTPDGTVLSQRVSDVLLQGSTVLLPRWTLDAGVQYSPELGKAVRSLVSARYSPGPLRTLSTAYRFTRDNTEQLELGWQWPLYGPGREALVRRAQGRGSASGCSVTWYGVGRLNYSLRDRLVTDSIAGVELDAGCWIGRIVAERLATGRSEATTRLLFQLELVGLSRLGANPLQALKDNVPGYQLLRERGAAGGSTGPGPGAGLDF